MDNRPNEAAPCGVFCGACPSFNKSCLGCPSESREQSRVSKWNCKIRRCCYEEQGLDFCGECSCFPCAKVNQKLVDSHPGELRYNYRHEIPENMAQLQELGLVGYLEYQRQRWTCSACAGRVFFYHYRCSECGEEIVV